MKIYEIYRYGRWMREIKGEEADLLQWVHDNVPANSETGIREGSLDSPPRQGRCSTMTSRYITTK